jgi:hypothetical protein
LVKFHVTKCAAEHIVCVLDYNGVRRILCITLSCCFPYTCYFYESFSVDINVTGPMTIGTERPRLNCYGCQLNCCTTQLLPPCLQTEVESASFTNILCHGNCSVLIHADTFCILIVRQAGFEMLVLIYQIRWLHMTKHHNLKLYSIRNWCHSTC